MICLFSTSVAGIILYVVKKWKPTPTIFNNFHITLSASSVKSSTYQEMPDKVDLNDMRSQVVKSGTMPAGSVSVPFDYKTAYSMYPSDSKISPDNETNQRSSVNYDFSKDPFNMDN